MITFPTSLYIEQFLDSIPGSHEFLKDLITALNAEQIPYALIGSLARKCWYEHAEATKDADILITYNYRKQLLRALSAVKYDKRTASIYNMYIIERNNCQMPIDILMSTEGFDPEESCVNDVVDFQVADYKVSLAKPEYLIWMLTRSPHERHKDGIKKLLTAPDLDIGIMLEDMLYAEDMEAFIAMEQIINAL